MSDICVTVTIEPPYNIDVSVDPPYELDVRLESIQGIGVAGVAINELGHLIVTLSNGSTLDAGSVATLVSAETTRAQAAEAALTTAVAAETRRAEAAESGIATTIPAIARREARKAVFIFGQ